MAINCTKGAELTTYLKSVILFVVYVLCLFGISINISFFVTAVDIEENTFEAFVADPVTEALDYVEAIERQRHNCTFGPTLNLQYSKGRWKEEAKITVRAANLLSFLSRRTASHILGSHQDDVDFLYAIVRANVDNYRQVFGSGIAFDTNLYRDYKIFCPYAFSTPDGVVLAKDLSIGYPYHNNKTDWFWMPYQMFYNYSYEEPSLSASGDGKTSALTLDDGYWTMPYFDCGGGDVWMVTFSMPFFVHIGALNNSKKSQESSDYRFA